MTIVVPKKQKFNYAVVSAYIKYLQVVGELLDSSYQLSAG